VIRFGEEMAAPLLHGEESRTHFHAVAAQLAKHLGSVASAGPFASFYCAIPA
jgi:hypothetical protein